MMRFRDAEPYDELAGTLRTILDEYSLKLRRADWKQHADLLWDNVRHYMDRSAYGIAIFDRLGADEVSPNVCLELGYMIARQRPCLLLKERSVPALQADLAGHLFVDFDLEDIRETVGAGVRSWLEDVGVAKRKGERMVVFVSEGGTCRDPMAKAITLDLLARRSGSLPLRVEALAKGEPSGSTASDGARTAIRELYGTDLLANHRTARLTPTAISDADLILVMERRMLKGLPPDKSFAIGRFFLEQDMDIQDPWSDQYDEASLARYRACAAELQKLITENFDRLLDRFRPT
jgi:protein-tyrosine-phosphatase